MNQQTRQHPDYRFVIGLVTGTFVGAGLAMWLTPRSASELRERVTKSARTLGQRATEQYRQASTRVGGVVDELTRKGEGVRNDVADAVARGAQEVERYATAARSDGVTSPGTHATADRPPSGPQPL